VWPRGIAMCGRSNLPPFQENKRHKLKSRYFLSSIKFREKNMNNHITRSISVHLPYYVLPLFYQQKN
jgi:hypothetical protein